MPPTSNRSAAPDLRLFADAAATRKQEFAQYETAPIASQSDEDADSDSPILDSVLQQGGTARVHQMTNFTLSELSTIWVRLNQYVLENWNTGKGKRTAQTPRDCFFTLLG